MGYKYLILSLHTHPCCYIFIDKDNELCGKTYDEIHEMIPLDAHGGLTFSEPTLYRVLEYSDKYKCDTLQSITYDWIIGWDYAHYGDFYYDGYSFTGKRYTTQELQAEVKDVIEQLNNCLNK